jgi:hypothetical protein
MSPFILSLKRLYDANRLTMTKLDELLTAGKVTQVEYEYITN